MNITGLSESSVYSEVNRIHFGGNDALLVIDTYHIYPAVSVAKTFKSRGHAVQISHDENGTHVWISHLPLYLTYTVKETDDPFHMINVIGSKPYVEMQFSAPCQNKTCVEKLWVIVQWACQNGYICEHFIDSSFQVILRRPHECFQPLDDDIEMD